MGTRPAERARGRSWRGNGADRRGGQDGCAPRVSEQPPPGVELGQVSLRGELPSVLADFASIYQDLAFAHAAADRYADVVAANGEQGDALMAQALWSAAAISYRRAFSSGK